ncbi:WD40 repeat domain-containing protein [Ferrovibrio sp.]|uniref:WD40 repeat domain-containing protein n=1 Tax=Ferrovibrio sp. TaxID=1917215 RepID=UPI003D292FDF
MWINVLLALGLYFSASFVAVASENPHSLPTPKLIAKFNHPNVWRLNWSGDEQYLVSAGLEPVPIFFSQVRIEPTVAIWSLKTKRLVKAHFRPGPRSIALLVGDEPQAIGIHSKAPNWERSVSFSVWNAHTGALSKHVHSQPSLVDTAAEAGGELLHYSYSHARRLLAVTRSLEKRVYVYDINTWNIVAERGASRDIGKLAFSRDGSRIAFNQGIYILIWNLETNRVELEIEAFERVSGVYCWLAGDRHIAALRAQGSRSVSPRGPEYDTDLSIWDVKTGLLTQSFPGRFGGAITHDEASIGCGNEKNYIATLTMDRVARVWSIQTGTVAHAIDTKLADSPGLSVSPIQNWLALSGADGVSIYSLEK